VSGAPGEALVVGARILIPVRRLKPALRALLGTLLIAEMTSGERRMHRHHPALTEDPRPRASRAVAPGPRLPRPILCHSQRSSPSSSVTQGQKGSQLDEQPRNLTGDDTHHLAAILDAYPELVGPNAHVAGFAQLMTGRRG
jgi:hypothetical protein